MLLHQNQQLSAVLNSIQQPESLGFNALKPLHAFEASLPQRPAQRPRRPGIESHPATLFFLTLSDSSDLLLRPLSPSVAANPPGLLPRSPASPRLPRAWAPANTPCAACGLRPPRSPHRPAGGCGLPGRLRPPPRRRQGWGPDAAAASLQVGCGLLIGILRGGR